MKKQHLLRLLAVIIGAWYCACAHDAWGQHVFMLNPESGVADIRKVKEGLDAYFRTQGISATTYVFANAVDFEDSVERLHPDIAIVASYYAQFRQDRFRWNVLLAGHNNQQKTFHKILIASEKFSDIAALKNKSIATVPFGLPEIVPGKLTMQEIRAVTVSKDIDAIMALGFEQVDAAIVTAESFEKLRAINPEVADKLYILQELPPIAYPVVVGFPESPNVESLARALTTISESGQAKSPLRFLGITGFVQE